MADARSTLPLAQQCCRRRPRGRISLSAPGRLLPTCATYVGCLFHFTILCRLISPTTFTHQRLFFLVKLSGTFLRGESQTQGADFEMQAYLAHFAWARFSCFTLLLLISPLHNDIHHFTISITTTHYDEDCLALA